MKRSIRFPDKPGKEPCPKPLPARVSPWRVPHKKATCETRMPCPPTHTPLQQWVKSLLSPQGCFTAFADPPCYLLQGCSPKLPYACHSLPNHPNTAPSLQSPLVLKFSVKYSFLKIHTSNVHSNIIYISQDIEATSVPINRWMVKKMWYI